MDQLNAGAAGPQWVFGVSAMQVQAKVASLLAPGVGSRVRIGVGAVVVRDVPARATVVGNPARFPPAIRAGQR